MFNKLKVGAVLGAVLSMGLLAGCAKGVNFNGTIANSSASVGGPTVVNVPSCEINMPQYELNANVNSFEFTGSNGVTFGYNPTGAYSGVGGSVGLEISNASMDLTMQAVNPLNQGILQSDEVTSAQTSTTINATIDFSGLSAGTTNYSSTPLSQVTESGLDKAVQAVQTWTNTQPYVGRVILFVNANTIMINGGSTSGIEVGDTFNIYNVTNEWTNMNSPCAAGNTYLGSVPTPTTPVAVATVISLDPSNNVSYATLVLPGTNPTAVNLGAEVIPLNLVAPAKGQPARYLKKNVILGTVAADSFTLPGGGTFDFGSAVNGQFSQAVLSNGFYVMSQ